MKANLNINYYRKNVYGNELMYVADPATAAKLAGLIGTKTISDDQMKRITALFGTTWTEVIAPRA